MGLIQDITTLMRKGPELASQVNNIKLNTKSVAKGAKDSTFQFPCLVVDSTPIDMANTVARTLDQVYASFTQTWLSMNSMFDITIDPTPMSYLKKLHQNLKLESEIGNLIVDDQDDVANYMEKVYDGSYRLYMNSDQSCGVVFNMTNRKTKEMMESHKDMLNEYLSEFDFSPIMEADAEMLASAVRRASDKFDDVNKSIFGDDEAPLPSADNELDLTRAMLQGRRAEADRSNRELNQKIFDKGSKAPQLLAGDVKRSNDLTPYGIQVRLIAVNDKKEFVQYMDFIVGVKTILHPVSSDDMIENIARAMQNKSVLFKVLKWTTGEISLVKDIILNLNDMKADAINKTSGRSPFFSTLKRLKNKKLGLRNVTVPHALIPNATIVITTYEADFLENKYGIKIRDEKVASKLINSLFLMSFIILDEGTGTISVLYDGDASFQTYALETLERDNNLNSNKLGREIGRMIAR